MSQWELRSKKDRANYLKCLASLYGNNITLPKIKPKVKRKREYPERDTQISIVKWCRSNSVLCHSIPNHGKRTAWAGEIERAMGLTAGVSDLFIAMPNRQYHGFYLEIKALGKKPTESQLAWMTKAREQLYKADWYDSADKAILAIQNYLADRN